MPLLRRSVMRRCLLSFGLCVGLGACADEPLQTAVSADYTAPAVADVLYPAQDNALFAHPAWKRLPADLPYAVVADLPAALTASGLAGTIAKGKEPYDQVVKAASVHALGMALASVTELGGAGLDLSAAWGMTTVERKQVVFGRIADAAKLKAKLAEHAQAEDAELEEETIGAGTWLRTGGERRHAAYLVDDVVFLIQPSYDRGKRVVDKLAQVKPGASLADHPEFAATVAGVKYGSHAAAFFSLAGTTENMKAGGDVELLERRFEELETWLEEHADEPEHAEKAAEIKDRLAHKDAEVAAAKARAETLEALPPLFGVAFGFDVDATTVRGKGFLALPDGLAKRVFGPARLAVDPQAKPAASRDAGPKLVNHYDLPLTPQAAVEVVARQLGTTRLRALRRWLGEGKLEAALTGAVGFSRYQVDNLPQSRLELGLLPGEGDELSKRLHELASTETLTVENEGGRLHLTQKTKYGKAERWVRLYSGGAVIATHRDLVDLRPAASQEKDPPLVLALESLPASDGVLSLQTANLLFATSFGLQDPQIARQAALRDAAEFGMIGLLSSGSLGAFMPPSQPRKRVSKRERTESEKEREKRRKKIERKRKKLEKRRAKARAERATLKQRRRIESSSGRTRVLTALGTTVARVHPTEEGAHFYVAQRIAEIDMNALGEHIAYALVDTSSQSETARQIEELDKKIKALDKALEDLPPTYMMMGLPSGILGSSMSAIDDTALSGIGNILEGNGGIGTRGSGRGGGGSAVGIGSLGTRGIGSGKSGYGSGSGKVKAGGGGKP